MIHEFGHIFVSCLFSWKIKKILFLPFGGITIFEMPINTSLKQEFYIAISGFFFQFLGYFFLLNFFPKEILSSLHYSLLSFNILPIIPLDGSKLVRIFLERCFPFKKSHMISIIISLIFHMFLLFYHPTFISFLLLLFLLKKEKEEIQYHSYYFHKFLLERYLECFPYRKITRVNSIKQMKKNIYHYIKQNGEYKSEKIILEEYFLHK